MRIIKLFAAMAAMCLAGCVSAPEAEAPSDDFSFPATPEALARARPLAAENVTIAAESADTGPGCRDEFLAGRKPVMIKRPPASELDELCFEHFAVLHWSDARGPLWSAYRLTKKMSVDGDAFTGDRPGYHPEARLKPDRQSRESDFANNPYDVGHMTPNNDMPEASSQLDSFSMANMSPQYDALNRVRWRAVEKTVHDLAKTAGEIYIVTGPIYSSHPKRMNGRVAIPDAFFKAVYDVSRDKAIAFVFDNTKDSACVLLTISDLQDLAGIKPFPSLSKAALEDSGEWTVPRVCDDD